MQQELHGMEKISLLLPLMLQGIVVALAQLTIKDIVSILGTLIVSGYTLWKWYAEFKKYKKK